jgi:hypothetical protein
MAVAWIERVANYHPTDSFKICYKDENRTVKRKDNNTVVQNGTYLEISPGQKIELDNCALPWNNINRFLEVRWRQNNKELGCFFDINGKEAWDYIRTRDSEYRELGLVEVGSLGDARGSNWSGWELALYSNSTIGFNNIYRQNTAESMGKFSLSLASQVAPELIKTAASIIQQAGPAALALIAA